MASIFTKIVNGEIPCYKIVETEDYLAFLDVNPNSKGHTLCIPKKEVDKIFDLDETTYNGLMSFSRTVAMAIEKAIPCERVGVSVIGLEVSHVHVHLIPLHSMDDARFIQKVKLSSEEFQEIASAIQSHL
ncbi:HIT family protein [Seonamhaeicola maritimus]|uniref:HIT family protein n=1 Tax=Seonamhaeicola maritimus TaxID=2591822 RepID=A0A5C7GI80_9FLAO|nr:HIT family protein [Seonamhaeicola maritimus]TXG36855.1 HIT family protein [Seonamhaeicola maritimus]